MGERGAARPAADHDEVVMIQTKALGTLVLLMDAPDSANGVPEGGGRLDAVLAAICAAFAEGWSDPAGAP